MPEIEPPDPHDYPDNPPEQPDDSATEGYADDDGRQAEADASDADFLNNDDNDLGGVEDDADVVGDTPEAVYAASMEEVLFAVDDTLQKVRADEITAYDTDTVGEIVADMLKDAAARGDIAAVDIAVGQLHELPVVDGLTLADGYIAGVRAGSQKAFDTLSTALAQEKVAYQARAEAGTLAPNTGLKLLEQVATACQQSGMPAETWIDAYATTPELKTLNWGIKVRHYENAIAAKAPDVSDAPSYQERLDTVAADLYKQPRAFDSKFIFTETQQLLRAVRDPDVRAELVDNWLQNGDTELTFATFSSLVRTSEQIAKDPILATDGTIGELSGRVDNCAERLVAVGIDQFSVAREQLPWEVQRARTAAVTPVDLVNLIDNKIGDVLTLPPSMNVAPAIDEHDRRQLLSTRDNFLQDQAIQYARQGNFDGARDILAYTTDDIYKEEGYRECLALATEPWQVEALKQLSADAEAFGIGHNPNSELLFAFASARTSGDPEAITAVARASAEELINTNIASPGEVGRDLETPRANDIRREVIHQAFYAYAALDEAGAPALAKELLAMLRDRGEPYSKTDYLSNVVIAAGDPEEPKRAYDSIESTAPPFSDRKLLRKWDLARLIAGRGQP